MGERERYMLCGTLGGVYCHLWLYSVDPAAVQEEGQQAPGTLVVAKTFVNEQFASFQAMASTFLKLCRSTLNVTTLDVPACCVSVAGPVDSNRVTVTNRSHWVLDGYALERALNIPRLVLANDYVCIGYGLFTLSPDEVVTIHEAPVVPEAPKACIGARTGLGECFLTCHEGQYTVFPSEGGHCEFAPRSALEVELLQFLKRKFGEHHRISVERVASTRGIEHVYEFFCERHPDQINPATHQIIMASKNKAGAILAHREADSLCGRTVDILITTLAAEAGCCALKWLPYGGLYVYGPIARKLLPLLQSQAFLKPFSDKGRYSYLLRQIPVKVVVADRLSKRGAHRIAFGLLQKYCNTAQRPRRQQDRLLIPKHEGYTVAVLCSAAAALLLALHTINIASH